MTKRIYPIVLPDKANYIATDSDGEVLWYENEPEYDVHHEWCQRVGGETVHITEIDPPADASKTLMKFNKVTGEYEVNGNGR